MFDFCERVDLRTVNKRVVESLTKAGAFDSVTSDRATLYNNIDRALEWGQRKQREAEVGQGGLFATLQDSGSDDHDMLTPSEPWPEALRLIHEKATLGFYITGHPIRQYAAEIGLLANATTGSLGNKAPGSEVTVGGIVAQLRSMRTKKGNRMGALMLEDLEGVVEVLAFPDVYARMEENIVADAPVIVSGKLDSDESTTKILASEIIPIEDAAAQLAKTVTVVVDPSAAGPDLADRLKPMVESKSGSAELVFELRYADKTVFLRPNPFLKVRPDKEFVDYVERICGPNAVRCSR